MFKNKLDFFLRKFFLHKNEELPSFLLSNLYHQGSYLPYTTSSLKFRLLACIVNEIVVNERKLILEFGSGISTIIMARLLKMNEISAKITTIDENSEWQNIIKNILFKEDLLNFVEFIHAPTEKTIDTEASYGYNSQVVFNTILSTKFDLLLIDGPSAWQKENTMSRSSNFQFIKNNLNERFTIFIDNSDRPGEKQLVNKIISEFKINPTHLDSTFLSFTKGQHFNYTI